MLFNQLPKILDEIIDLTKFLCEIVEKMRISKNQSELMKKYTMDFNYTAQELENLCATAIEIAIKKYF